MSLNTTTTPAFIKFIVEPLNRTLAALTTKTPLKNNLGEQQKTNISFSIFHCPVLLLCILPHSPSLGYRPCSPLWPFLSQTLSLLLPQLLSLTLSPPVFYLSAYCFLSLLHSLSPLPLQPSIWVACPCGVGWWLEWLRGKGGREGGGAIAITWHPDPRGRGGAG